MWFMNHLFNPIMRWILNSPLLHKLASKDVLLIAFMGKKSGKHYTTPVQYLQDGRTIWIMVGFPDKKKWWRNLVGGAPVNLCLRGEWVSGEAVVLQGAVDRDKVRQGLEVFAARNPGQRARLMEEAAIEKTVLVQVLLD